MIKKKGKFWTFVFSCMPGAGQMYLGFMKQGVSLMGAFFVTIFLGSLFNSDLILLLSPILWFYAFFDANNKAGLDDADFYALEDRWLFDMRSGELQEVFQGRQKLILAIACFVIGGKMLWDNFMETIQGALDYLGWSEALYWELEKLPQIIFAFLIIYLGLRLIRGKKRQYDNEKEIIIEEERKN